MGFASTALAWWLLRGRRQPHADRSGAGSTLTTIVDREGNHYHCRANVRLGAAFSGSAGLDGAGRDVDARRYRHVSPRGGPPAGGRPVGGRGVALPPRLPTSPPV